MKAIFTFLIATLTIINTNAQSDVYFKINHLLGTSTFGTKVSATNNLNNDFKVARLQYYVSDIKVSYNNGLETTFTDTWILVDAEETTKILLGTWALDSITSVSFSIGVNQNYNHLDPSTYPANHPLANQSPSMHWGWTSGYRFVAMEGTCDANFSQNFEIHALGDANYFTTTVDVSVKEINNEFTIELDGDYTGALKDIDLSGGLINHGVDSEATDLLMNFSTSVFTATPSDPNSIFENNTFQSINIFPNPISSNGVLQLSNLNQEAEWMEIKDLNGRQIHRENIKSSYALSSLNLTPGLYILSTGNSRTSISINKLLITE